MGEDDLRVVEVCKVLAARKDIRESLLLLAVNRYQMHLVYAVREFVHAGFIVVPVEENDLLRAFEGGRTKGDDADHG